MTKNQLQYYVDNYYDIEFLYNGKKYSITYYEDDRDDYISFCEFYKTPKDVKNFEKLCDIKVNGVSLLQIIESLPEDNISIY